jgi:hypothetical protein
MSRSLRVFVELVALTDALTDASKESQLTRVFADVVDNFHNEHGLAHAGTADNADLAALDEGSEEVEHLDAGLEQLVFVSVELG